MSVSQAVAADRIARQFRAQLRQAGLRVHSVSWVQGGYSWNGGQNGGPGGEIAAIEAHDDREINRALEILSPATDLDITRITPTRIFIGIKEQS
jgi:hypothetical protein